MKGQDAMEWNGFNNYLARSQNVLKPASIYMFGPLIDAPPSHPHTILTTLTYMQMSLLDMGMIHIHLSMDMQPFKVTNKYADTILSSSITSSLILVGCTSYSRLSVALRS